VGKSGYVCRKKQVSGKEGDKVKGKVFIFLLVVAQ
jgi:hypothetical protein